jgi:hypothetical protein
MNNEQKGQLYSELMRQFDYFRNKIADVRSTQVNLTESQEQQIRIYESEQTKILTRINQLLK